MFKALIIPMMPKKTIETIAEIDINILRFVACDSPVKLPIMVAINTKTTLKIKGASHVDFFLNT